MDNNHKYNWKTYNTKKFTKSHCDLLHMRAKHKIAKCSITEDDYIYMIKKIKNKRNTYKLMNNE